MSQGDIIDLLNNSDRPLSRSEIAEALDVSPIKISMTINKLLKFNEILFKEIDRIEALEKYHCKRRMKIYYSKENKKKSKSK